MHKKIKQELIEASKSFYQRGWMFGTSGNLSALVTEKKPEFKFLISVSGRDKGKLNEKDFILVDQDGQAVKAGKPSAETLLHSMIYQQTDARVVFHVHTPNVTLLSMEKDFLQFSGLEMLKGFGFQTHEVKVRVPIIDNSQDMKTLSKVAAKSLIKSVPGLILRGHGIYAWGEDFLAAKRHVEIFEFLFDYEFKRLALGKS